MYRRAPTRDGAAPKRRKLLVSNVLCVDFLGSHLKANDLELQLRNLVQGIQVSDYIAWFWEGDDLMIYVACSSI